MTSNYPTGQTPAVSYRLNAGNARELGGNSFIDQKGAYEGSFTRAQAVTSAKGTRGIEFDFVTADGRSHANYLTVWIQSASGEELFGRKVLDGILTCLGVREIKSAEAMVKKRNYETRQDEQVRATVFPDLMGKPIGVVLHREEFMNSAGISKWKNVLLMPFEAKTRRLPGERLDSGPAVGLDKIVASLRDKPLREGEAGPQFGNPRASAYPQQGGHAPAGKRTAPPAPAQTGGSGFDDMDDDVPF